jgi:hypothetical protein
MVGASVVVGDKLTSDAGVMETGKRSKNGAPVVGGNDGWDGETGETGTGFVATGLVVVGENIVGSLNDGIETS